MSLYELLGKDRSPATAQQKGMLYQRFVLLILIRQAEFPVNNLDATLTDLLSNAGVPTQMIVIIKAIFGLIMKKYVALNEAAPCDGVL
jgi:hypothetical protein